jgi:hypothetical protein
MRKNKWLVRVLMAALAATGFVEGAEKVRYEDIANHLARLPSVVEYRGILVITLDGKEHRSRRAEFEPSRVRLFLGKDRVEDLPAEQVSRIEISQGGRFFHHIVRSAAAPVEMGEFFCEVLGDLSRASPGCVVVLTAVLSPIWAYTAATSPFYLAADSVAFFVPPKAYEILH